eukprot:jgi/Tetstr1/431693/TSEL_021218.t1
MEAIDDGLNSARPTSASTGIRTCSTALGGVRERYLRPDTKNLGSPELTEHPPAQRANDCDRDGGGSRRKHFKTPHPGREAVAPQATFAKDVTEDSGMSKTNVEAPTVDTTE